MVAFLVNVILGCWALTFNDEYKLFSLVFFIPACTGLILAISPSGSRLACIASALVLALGVCKLIFAAVSAVFANEAGRSASPASGLGVLVFTTLAILSGASAISDLVVGCSGYLKWRSRRSVDTSFKEEITFSYDI